MYCSNCGSSIPDSASFCPSCGASTPAAPQEQYTVPPSRKKPGKKLVFLAAGVLLLLAVVLFVVAHSTGSAGPATKIVQAAENTFTADSFSVDFDIRYIYSQEYIFGTLWISYDPKHQDLTLYGEGTIDGGHYNNDPFRFAVCDDITILGSYGPTYDSYGNVYGWSYSGFTQDVIAREYDLDELSETYDFEKLEQCVSSFIKKMDDEEWITNNAGYSFESDGASTRYSFSPPNPSRFATKIAPDFEDLFLDPADYEEWLHDLPDELDELIDMDVIFEVKEKELVSTYLSVLADGGDVLTTIECTFYDIGAKENRAQIEKAREILENEDFHWED